MKKLFVSIIAGLSLIFLTACGGGDSPESVAQKFFEETLQGDIDKAIALLDWGDEEAKIPEDQRENAESKLRSGVNFAREKYVKDKISKITTDGVEYNQDKTKATVNVVITTKEGKEEKGLAYLVRRDGKWKILVQTLAQ